MFPDLSNYFCEYNVFTTDINIVQIKTKKADITSYTKFGLTWVHEHNKCEYFWTGFDPVVWDLAGLIRTGGQYRGGGGGNIGSRDKVNRRGEKACEGQWKSRSRKDRPRMEKRFKVEVPPVTRPPFPRLITRQTETDEAEGQRCRGETAVKIESDYTGRRRENKEQEVQCQREGERDQGLNPTQLWGAPVHGGTTSSRQP